MRCDSGDQRDRTEKNCDEQRSKNSQKPISGEENREHL
jgi:hypothetical protein